MRSSSQQAFDRVFRQERDWNAYHLNAIRPAGLVLFLVPQLLLCGVTPGTWPLFVYGTLATALFVLARKSPRVARWSALAVPVLDMPAVFLKQWLDMVLPWSNARAMATFTLGVFVVLLMLSAFTLQNRHLILAAVVAIGLELALQFKAADTLFGKVGSAATLLVAMAVCQTAMARRVRMVQSISEERLRLEKLGRYFSPQVATRIQETENDFETGQVCQITVLFSDLRGFSATTEHWPPAEVLNLLNEVHSRMVEVIFAHEGTLDKYMGDGMMAYFGAPVPQPDHAVRALRCALAMQSGIAALNAIRSAQGRPCLRLSIGLHSGAAIVGAIGAANRREFTAVGDTVNLAARMEDLTRRYDFDVLVSGETAGTIGDRCRFHPVAETFVKGRAAAVQVFAPAVAELAHESPMTGAEAARPLAAQELK